MRKRPRENARIPRTILEVLEGPGPFVITGHIRPDGDFLGTAVALARWLGGRGERVTVVSRDGVPAPYGFLPGADDVTTDFPACSSVRTAIALDTPAPERTGAPEGFFGGVRHVVNIDHHPDNTRFGDAVLVDPSASSVAFLVYEIMRAADAPIDAATAVGLYVGILTDTGGFRFANTDAPTLGAACDLAARGARPAEIARAVYGSLTPAELGLLGLVLSSAEPELGGRALVLCVTDDMRRRAGTDEEAIEGLASYGRSVRGVEVAVLLREQGRGVRASLRSNGDLDVGAVARELGGGGHAAAAGVDLVGSLSDARGRLLTAVGRRVDGGD